jgi:Ku70/Ku80 beta-barrel domain
MDEDEPQPDVIPSGEDPDLVYYEEIEDRERLLASIAEKTGGSVASIASMQELLDAKAGKRRRYAVRNKFDLHVGPGLTVSVRKIKLMSKLYAPKMKHQILGTEDEDGNLEEGKKVSELWYRKKQDEDGIDEDDEDDRQAEKIGDHFYANAEAEEQASAIRYGRDLIPVGDFENQGLKAFDLSCGYEDDTYNPKTPNVHIFGYANRDSVHQRYMIGPPNLLFGEDSKQACTVVAALAQTLSKLDMIALGTYKATKSSKPTLAALYPFEAEDRVPPTRLMLFELPWDDDVKKLHFHGFTEVLEGENDETQSEADERTKKQQACDKLVDAMMLDSDTICSEKIPSPFHTAFHKTILQRAVRGQEAGLVNVRGDAFDKIVVPSSVLGKAKPALAEFRSSFPLRKKKVKKIAKGRGKKGMATYTDHLDTK